MASSNPSGYLLIIGGAEEKEGECTILKRFMAISGGPSAKLVVMTAATEQPEEVGREYVEAFARIGAPNVSVLDLENREEADSASAAAAIAAADGVFFTGGDQQRIIELLRGTDAGATLHRRYDEGLAIAGTSAGAAMMADPMIVQGESGTNPNREIVELGPGMGFLPNTIICMHFATRARSGRLLAAVARHPGHLGIGIDENTALVVQGRKFEVIGDGAVYLYDMSGPEYTNLTRSTQENDLALQHVVLHVLPSGYSFDLEMKQPVIEEKAPNF